MRNVSHNREVERMIEKNVPLFAEKKDPKPTFRWYFCLYFKGPLRQFKTQRNI